MNSSNAKLWIGAALVILGILFLMNNVMFLPFSPGGFIFSWPTFFALVGIIILVNSRDSGFGLILLLIGLLGFYSRFTGHSFRYLLSEYWPIGLIILGLFVILRRNRPSKKHHAHIHVETGSHKSGGQTRYNTVDEDEIDEVSIFSSQKKKITSSNFRGGKLLTVFGGTDIDLLDCKLATPEQTIDIVTIFGGSDIFVPRDMKVNVKVVSIFGGFDDKRRIKNSDITEDSGTLVLTGFVIFGGGDLKN